MYHMYFIFNILLKIKGAFSCEFSTIMKEDTIVYQTIYDMILLHIIVYAIYMYHILYNELIEYDISSDM